MVKLMVMLIVMLDTILKEFNLLNKYGIQSWLDIPRYLIIHDNKWKDSFLLDSGLCHIK